MTNNPLLFGFGFRTISLLYLYVGIVSSETLQFSVGPLFNEDWNEDKTSIVNAEIWKYIRNETGLLYTNRLGWDLYMTCSGNVPVTWNFTEETVRFDKNLKY
jgi:hypothetical protein